MNATLRKGVIAGAGALVLVSVSGTLGFASRGSNESASAAELQLAVNDEASAARQSGVPSGGGGWELLFMFYGR